MKIIASATLAIGLAAAVSTSAFAQCASKNITAETKTNTPIVTADSSVKTDQKG
ncbi:MAG: hypothetical protein H7Y08_12355 [Rhizobiaceae bacterium]|nr:hypothetical protein [Rhizobiaceae bacterium]